ncbi:MAG: permease [Candidatus Hydrogenedentes bacterium CG07_land_8_20_14_0_80_42_17]|nr:MAG: permease [Candidatus Hydrogenedentes bacterium CG07_land_8_20_14_0_80_42_17]
MIYFFYALLGIAVGVLSGFIGLGGGIFFVPALVAFFKMSQHEAQGTTLALMVPPIGIFAAWTYYKNGFVNLPAAGAMCLGFALGGWLGAVFAQDIPDANLQKIFGTVLILTGIKMFF